MTAPVVVGRASGGNSGGSSFDVNIPAGSPGELIVCAATINNTNSFPFTIPDGYTQLYSEVSETYISGIAFYKIADGTEGSTATFLLSASNQVAAKSFRISGFSGVPEVEVSAIGNSTTNLPPPITPSYGTSDYLYIVIDNIDTYLTEVTTFPTGYINTGSFESGTGAACEIAWGEKYTTATSSETPTAFEISAARRTVTATIAIAGIGSGPDISGTGAFDSQQSLLSGSGTILSTKTGSGTLQSINSIVSGSGSILSNITGLGNLYSGDSLLSGVGYKIVYVTGSGILQSINSELSGIGFSNSATIGYGTLELQDSILNGLGFLKSNHVGSGIIESGDSSISGIAISFKVINGNAVFATGDSSISGVGGSTSGVIGYGSLLISESQLSGLGQVFGNIIGTGNLKSNSNLSGQGIVKGNIFAVGNIKLSNSIIEGIGRISIKVIGTGNLASSDSILEGYDVLYTWNEICKQANTWTEINPTDVAMIRCGPAISVKSGVYPEFIPYEFIGTNPNQYLSIIVNTITNTEISAGEEYISTGLSNSQLDIVVNTIEQKSISAGDESITNTFSSLILIIESNVIAQESLSAGDESLDTLLYGSLGITIS